MLVCLRERQVSCTGWLRMYDLTNIKREIECVRNHLNTAIKYKADKEYILIVSRMLDNLIYEYYIIQDKKKKDGLLKKVDIDGKMKKSCDEE